MPNKTPKPMPLFVYIVAVVICLSGTGFWSEHALAHSPHDPIDVLALSPGYGRDDSTLFIAISDQLLKSADGGYSWAQLANGLDNSQLISSIYLSPFFTQDRTLFFSTAGEGIFRTEDGGLSWVRDNHGLTQLYIERIVISASGTMVALDADGGLWQKHIDESDWVRLPQYPAGITSMCFSVTRSQTPILFLGDREGNLYTSLDEGRHIELTNTLPDSGPITIIEASPRYSLDHTLFVGTTQKGVFKSMDGGIGFMVSGSGIADPHVVDLAVSAGEGDNLQIYATTWHQAVFVSLDGADSWRLLSENLTTDQQADTQVYYSPHFRQVALSKAFDSDQTLFVGGFDGLFVSNSGGTNWKQLETLPLSLVKGLDIFSSPESTSIAVTTYGGGAYLSGDKGNSWVIGNKGLVTTRLSDVRFSPAYQRDKTLFSASKGYLLKSEDEGKSWHKMRLIYSGLRKRAAGFLNTIMIKLKIPFSWTGLLLDDLERMHPWPTVIAVSHDYEKDKTLFFGTREHGIYRTTDGGKTNQKVWDAEGRVVSSLVISPEYLSDKTLFASVRVMGVYRSVDSGKTWTNTSEGFTFIADWAGKELVHQIEKKDIKLVISPDFKRDRTLFARSSEGCYRSTDAGDSWQKLEDPIFEMTANIIGAAISPNYHQDRALIISIKGRGIYWTSDAGKSFRLLSRELIKQNHNIEYIKFSPLFQSDKTIVAASDEEVFLSTDSGSHWQMLPRPVRYENYRTDVLRYNGDWSVKTGREFSANSISVSDSAGAGVELDFVGTGIKWLGPESGQQGKARVFIDGELQPLRDPGKRDTGHVRGVYIVQGLPPGAHRIRIEAVDPPAVNPEPVSIDAFDIIP